MVGKVKYTHFNIVLQWQNSLYPFFMLRIKYRIKLGLIGSIPDAKLSYERKNLLQLSSCLHTPYDMMVTFKNSLAKLASSNEKQLRCLIASFKKIMLRNLDILRL